MWCDNDMTAQDKHLPVLLKDSLELRALQSPTTWQAQQLDLKEFETQVTLRLLTDVEPGTRCNEDRMDQKLVVCAAMRNIMSKPIKASDHRRAQEANRQSTSPK